MATTRRPTRGTAGAKRETREPERPERPLLGFIPEKHRSLVWIGAILLSLLLFFGGVIFGGEYFGATDNISYVSFEPYLDHMEEKGEIPLWVPYVFSGMPAFAAHMVTGDRWWDLTMKVFYTTESVVAFVNRPVMRIVLHYFLLGLGVFLLMRTKGVERPIAFYVALGVIFSTWIIVWIMIGHNTKGLTLAALPFILICIEKLIHRWSILYAALLVMLIHFLAEAGHIQTAFYAACAVGIYLLVELIHALLAKESKITTGVVRAALIGVLGVGFAYGMGLDRNLAVQEYLPYSTRGSEPLVDTTTQDPYTYATNWSFALDESFTFFVPSYFGFGRVDNDIAQKVPELAQYAGQELPTYWGQMPFTDAAHYAGIGVLILALFGAFVNRRNRFAQAMIFVALFGFLLSMGNNSPSILYDFFYNVVPGFNNFRAPSQALVLVEFSLPILAGLGLHALIGMRRAGGNDAVAKYLLYCTAAAGLFLLIGFAVKGSFIEAFASSQTGQQYGQIAQPVAEVIWAGVQTDWMFSGLFAIATILLMWAYLKRKITTSVMLLSMIGILLFDLWRVDYRPMKTVPKEQALAVFNETDVDRFLKQDSSQYRVIDIMALQSVPNEPVHDFQEHVGGYSSAKMRAYQDLMDVTNNANTAFPGQASWDILNTKYIIAPQPIEPGAQQVFQSQTGAGNVYLRPNALPRAWFVDRVEVADGKTILERIRDKAFNPREVAFVEEQLPAQVESLGIAVATVTTPAPTVPAPTAGDTTASGDTTAALPDSLLAPAPAADYSARDRLVRFTKYEPLELEMEVEAPKTNFLVISEMHYPPGWSATIDGKPAEVVKTNYVMRGLVIPPGKHQIRFVYDQSEIETGKWVSLALNLIVFAAIAFGLVVELGRSRRSKRKEEIETDVDSEGV